MSDSDHDKTMVYLAYRDIFKDRLAKLRKRSKVRNVVEKHKDHLHHKQLADSIDSKKICKILGDLLAARLFESEPIAQATFPTLFSLRESGNDSALIVKCVDDGFDRECGQRVGENPDSLPSLDILRYPDIHMQTGASLESAPPVRQHRIDRKSGRVRKPTRATTNPTTNPTGAILQVGKTVSKEAFLEGIEMSLPNNASRIITLITTIFADRGKSQNVLKRKRDSDITPTNPTYLPSRLQHLILTQTQRLLEECCYTFAEKWFPSMLEANSWDAPEAVELSKWWKALSKCDIPTTAIALGQDQSLAVLFRRAIRIRHCAVHRRPQIPVNKVKEMIGDAWLLSQVLQDDLRAARLLHWYKELESLVEHLELRTNSQREAAEAELGNIQNAKAETEERLAELELRESQLTRSLEVEGSTHQSIDAEALRPLEEALGRPALTKTLFVNTQDQVWQWIENSVGMITILKHAANRTFSLGMSRYF
jgi:hypothetical protein